jgi:hypothetical protein
MNRQMLTDFSTFFTKIFVESTIAKSGIAAFTTATPTTEVLTTDGE